MKQYPHCAQCNEPLEGSNAKSYVVGWCRQDVHVGCLLLHFRTCPDCRPWNETTLAYHDNRAKAA